MNLIALIRQNLPALVAHLPVRYQHGKMPYVFLFVVVVIAVLLTYAFISPHTYAMVTCSSFAVCLAL